MMIKFRMLFITRLILIVSLAVACSSDSNEEDQLFEEPKKESPTDHETPIIPQTCDATSDFPNLGPSASQSQSCDDVSNPNNQGTLDCRTDNTIGGYENLGNDWGSYKITGGEIRYDGTRTRVERFFKNMNQGKNKKTILSGSLKIIDLSDGNTCIIQSHAGGEILKGEEIGNTNRSAQFLLYAKKGSGNTVQLQTHTTINPYTTETGGARDVKNFATLNYNQEYTFIYETGYDADGIAFSKIKIGSTEKHIKHTHTTERVYSRYGAYGTGDSGDVTAHVEFKDIALCRVE